MKKFIQKNNYKNEVDGLKKLSNNIKPYTNNNDNNNNNNNNHKLRQDPDMNGSKSIFKKMNYYNLKHLKIALIQLIFMIIIFKSINNESKYD